MLCLNISRCSTIQCVDIRITTGWHRRFTNSDILRTRKVSRKLRPYHIYTAKEVKLHTDKDILLPPEKAFEWAHDAMREQNWGDAAQRWSVLRQGYPDHPAPWFQGAAAHIKIGEFDQAEKLLTEAHQKHPAHPAYFFESVKIANARQDWETANKLLEHAHQSYPDNLQTWLISAESAEKQGEQEQAKEYYRRACQCNPELPAPFIQMAEFAMRAEQWELALEYWNTVRSRFPDHPNGDLRASVAASKLGRTQEARQLTLAHQYGPDFLTNESNDQNLLKPQSRQQTLTRLLELIWTKARFNLRSEVHRNYLSYGWWVLEPLLHMVVYYVVFGLLLQRGGGNFPVFLLTGLIPWMWFMKAVSISSGSIISGQNLILQVGLPSVVFPLVSLLQATLKQVPVFILLFAFVALQGFPIGPHWWALLPVVFSQMLLTAAFACIVAAVIPFARDLSYLVPTGLTFLMFMSGIFYDYRTISEEWQSYFLLNPLAFLLKCYREIFMAGIIPDLVTLAWWGLGSACTCLLMLWIFSRLRYVYPRIILE
jgi:lipopolysaccharide transport system permease protein